ncbi:MAG TPA: DUF3313 family protein [Rhizomicrobium sp.]|nr:DUF3313 family protein [Rhizomicrobium sp.]
MNRWNSAMWAGAIALALFAGGQSLADPPQTLPGGLQRVQTNKVTLAYVRPGTNWGKYKTILLRKLAVPANARNAAPPGAFPEFGESYLLSDSDVATLQQSFSDSMHNVLSNAGFTFVTKPQADTLIVAPQIVKILLNAPIQNTRETYSGMGFTVSQGGGAIEMAAVLGDGASNTVIAEVVDRKYGSNMWGLNNSVTNLAEARDIFDQWANDLSDRLTSK